MEMPSGKLINWKKLKQKVTMVTNKVNSPTSKKGTALNIVLKHVSLIKV